MTWPDVIDRCYRAARRFIQDDLRAHDCAIAVIAAFLAATREPSEAMQIAARDWSRKKYGTPIGNDAAEGCWRAMHAVLARELGVEP